MPGSAPGTQKVVRGLSRVSSVSPASVPSSGSDSTTTTRYDLHSLSTALFGSTPPSDDESPLRATSPSSSAASISPPPAYTTIYPPSPPLSAASSATSLSSSASEDRENEKRQYRLPVELGGAPATLLGRIFPKSSPVHEFPVTNISLDDVAPSFSGAVLNNHAAGTRTLYVGGGDYEHLDLRETICGILERAEEELGCTGVVLALEKSTPDLGGLLHSLMYVGGVIATGPFTSNSNYLLIGLDL